jgi:WD40 repeat protein
LSTSLQDSEIQVEITHETLISEWPTLKAWVTSARQNILFHRRLTEAAANWKKKTGGVWRSPELDRLREFRERAPGDLTALEVSFYEASERQSRFETLAKRAAVAIIVTAAIVTSILAAVAFQQQKQARIESVLARAHQLAAESNAALTRYPQRSLLLAVEAQRLGADTVSPEQALRDSLGRISGRGLAGTGGSIQRIMIAAEAPWLVVKGTGEKISIHTIPASPAQKSAVRFLGYGRQYEDLDASADSRWVVTADDKRGVKLWNFKGAGFPASVNLPGGQVHAFSPDGHWFAAATAWPAGVRLWSLKGSPSDSPFVTVPLEAEPAEIAASNSIVVASLKDGVICAINFVRPQSGCKHIGTGNGITQMRLSQDGRFLIGQMRTKDGAWKGGNRVLALVVGADGASARNVTLLDGVARPELITVSHNSQWVAITTGTDLNTGNGGLIHLCRLDRPLPSCFALDEHRGNVTTLLFTNDDKALVSTSWDGTARIWNLQRADPSKSPLILRGHNGFVTTAALDPAGKWLATSGNDQNVVLWDMKARDAAASGSVYRGMEAPVASIAFSSDGRRLAAGADDGGLRIWDLRLTLPSANPDTLHVQLGHSDVITGMTFTPDMRWAFTYEGDNGEIFTLRRVTRDKRADSPILIPFKLERYVLDASFSEDSRWLAVSDQNINTTKLYDLSTDEPLRHETDLTGVFPGLRNRNIFSPDHHWAVTFDDSPQSKGLTLWDLTASGKPTRHQLTKGGGTLADIRFSPDSKWVLCTDENSLHAIDLKAPGSDFPDRLIAQDVGDTPREIWFAPGNDSVAYVSKTSILVTADLQGKENPTQSPLPGGDARVRVSPDRNLLLVSSDPSVRENETADERLARDLAHLHGASSKTHMALWSWSGKLYTPISSGTSIEGQVDLTDFSPTSHWLLTATDRDANPTLWNLGSSDPFSRPIHLWGHASGEGHNWHVAFTSDERWLATTGSHDSSIRMWNLESNDIPQSVTVLSGRKSSTGSIFFSSDNKLLVAIDGKGPRMWRLGDKGVSDTFVSLGDVVANEESVENAFFGPGNDELVTSGGDKVSFWSLGLPDLVRKAEAAAGRNFTWDEWARSFPGKEYTKILPDLPVDASVVSGVLEQAHLQLLKHDTQKARQLYDTAAKWSQDIADPAVSNDVAWKGATDNMAAAVFPAAEAALQMDPGNGQYRDTRALIRALRGDTSGAIEDYDAYLQWSRFQQDEPQADIKKRQEWITALRSGSNPFNDALLRSLRDE